MSERVRVRVADRELHLSHLDKVLYPRTGYTKAEVIDYYTRIGPVILPHLRDRPLTRFRTPDGVEEPGFFEKNLPAGTPSWVRRQRLPVPGSGSDRESLEFVVVDELATLVWLANLAAVELHTPQWRLAGRRPTSPDQLVIDLDPGPGVGLAECCAVALAARDRLRRDGLEPVAKTSGKKGMQLVCRLDATRDSATIAGYVRTIATELERAAPELVTATMAKHHRVGRVFLDWSQNVAAKTTVSVYSLRATPEPAVSAPVTWAEVEAAEVRRLSPAEVLARVERDGDLFGAMV